ncbi:dispatched homolog 3 [Seminavis robusta]|uniref:Dispatched homolog 3 n=1 Tax=Seminavis robusta TaxID=568900 RepID=A0A9N8HG57_9STRA|nr:dispatched homolog 3 [Seminavis robusta]|eukprot:Sro558_g166350.1 dispatched homolog 3 (1188) ;mRNA; r:44997-48655
MASVENMSTELPPPDVAPEKAVDSDAIPVWFNVRRTTSSPCKSCAFMCGMWILTFATLVFLSVAVGTLEFELGVPFYDRAEINQEREDSYKATNRDADWVAAIGSGSGANGDCVHESPTVLTRNGTLLQGPAPSRNCQRAGTHTLNVLFVSKDRKRNILTADNLKQIQNIEDHILASQDLTKYCHLIDSNYTVFPSRDLEEWEDTILDSAGATEMNHAACRRISSPLNFMDPLYYDYVNETGLGYHLVPSDVVPQDYNLEQDNIFSVVSYWAGFPELKTFNLSGYPTAVSQTGGTSLTLPNMFHKVVSSEFTTGSTEAVGLISSYPLGLPIHGYASSSESRDEQFEETGQWLWDEFDTYLKGASFGDVDVYFSDSEGQMAMAEGGYLAMVSFSFFPASIFFVLVYLTYMQDSIFIGLVGIMQILLSFLPGVLLYRYLFQETYLGILNLIAVYIILGIGVSNLFVFCDQFNHHVGEKRFDQRMQKTFNTVARTCFNTSCTTFVSFMSNAVSVFPAVAAFGLFAALLVLVNYCAVILFFPSAYAVYFKHIKHRWYDHPSRIICCNTTPWTDDIFVVAEVTNDDNVKASHENDSDEYGVERTEVSETQTQADEESRQGDSRGLVTFFRETWGPMVIKFRFLIVIFFLGVFGGALYLMGQLEPEEDIPQILPDSNNYVQYSDVLLENFARAGNPTAIQVYWVSGINPDEPIDRTGTVDTNTTDYGVSNYVDCNAYDPSTPAAQVWGLQTCHDMFFGNVTEYHGGNADFVQDGAKGPRARRIISDLIEPSDFNYYSMLSCPAQGMRDWLLTDNGCAALTNVSLPCYEETRLREGCTTWDTEGNSCEPYPVPSEHYGALLEQFLFDPQADPTTRLTNYEKYYDQIFVAQTDELTDKQQDQIESQDFSCRHVPERDLVLLSISSKATLEQDFGLSYEDGIELYELWDSWSGQMKQAGPREMTGTMQTSNGAWAFYYLSETLIDETYSSIYLALGLGFVILAVVGGNPIMAFFSVFTICLIVVDVFAFTVLMGWSLGILEAVNYVVVIGLSIDYCVHMSEAYTKSHSTERFPRVIHTFEEMGISVLSSSLSTLGASFFMFFAPVVFFVKFAAFIFVTITLSAIYSLTFFPAVLSIMGPTGDFGNWHFWVSKMLNKNKNKNAESSPRATPSASNLPLETITFDHFDPLQVETEVEV